MGFPGLAGIERAAPVRYEVPRGEVDRWFEALAGLLAGAPPEGHWHGDGGYSLRHRWV